MTPSIRRSFAIAWQVLTVVLTSVVIGAGIGFFQGEIVARKLPRTEQIAFAEGACMIGAEIAIIAGPLIYFLVFGRKMITKELFGIVAFALLVGTFAAVVIPEWISMFATILATIAATAFYREHQKS